MRLSKRTIRMLKEVGRKYLFVTTDTKHIRVYAPSKAQDHCCPITAIVGKPANLNLLAMEYAPSIGIPKMEASQIIAASDNPEHPYRKQLMKHLGMDTSNDNA